MHCDILIAGGEGDLAFRKLYPALYHLDKSNNLSDCLKIVGVARKQGEQDSFVEKVRENLALYVGPEGIDESVWKRFAARLNYASVDATSRVAMEQLRNQFFAAPERDLMVYLATPPSIFAPICKTLQAVGLVRDKTRIVVEKPLGDNCQSFLEINHDLTSIFEERQVYRIDHYLGKEAVQNLLALRFANTLFEPLWNNKFVDHVQITVAETVGIEGRWDFYDEAGALRDMVQNHLLQLLCLTAMEPPAHLAADEVRDEKLKVLRSLKPIDSANVKTNTVRGQYAAGAVGGQPVPGYCEEEGSENRSTTETFVALKAEIDNWRWSGVPFYLRTGKRLPQRFSEIVIQFKQVPHSIFGADKTNPNCLVIRLQPDDSINLTLMSKVPGLDSSMPLQSVPLDLSFSEAFANQRGADAYERLLFDVLQDNPTLFVRADEVEAAWAWIDRIRDGWKTTGKKVSAYTAGSWGPSEAIALLAKDDRNWYDMV